MSCIIGHDSPISVHVPVCDENQLTSGPKSHSLLAAELRIIYFSAEYRLLPVSKVTTTTTKVPNP